MYKVKAKDVIKKWRTSEQVSYREKKGIKVAGCKKKYAAKGAKMFDQLNHAAQFFSMYNPAEVIEHAHKLMDLANSHTAENAVCQKGCSWCCRVNVSVTRLEAEYIEQKVGRQIIKKLPYDKPHDSEQIPYCPFHDDKTATCKIHQFRPAACRGFFAFDSPKYCEDGSTVHATMNAFSGPHTKDTMGLIYRISGGHAGDIRYWFGEDTVSVEGK